MEEGNISNQNSINVMELFRQEKNNPNSRSYNFTENSIHTGEGNDPEGDIRAAIRFKQDRGRVEIRDKRNKQTLQAKRQGMIQEFTSEKELKQKESFESMSKIERTALLKSSIQKLEFCNDMQIQMIDSLQIILQILRIDFSCFDSDQQLLVLCYWAIYSLQVYDSHQSLLIIDVLSERLSSSIQPIFMNALLKQDFVQTLAKKLPIAPQQLLNNILYSLYLVTEDNNKKMIDAVVQAKILEIILERFSFQKKETMDDTGWVFLLALYSHLTVNAQFPENLPYFVGNVRVILGFLQNSLEDQEQDQMMKYHCLKSLASLARKESRFAQLYCEQQTYLEVIRNVLLDIGTYPLLMEELVDILSVIASLNEQDHAVCFLIFGKSQKNEIIDKAKEIEEINVSNAQNNSQNDPNLHNNQGDQQPPQESPQFSLKLMELIFEILKQRNFGEKRSEKIFSLFHNILLSGKLCTQGCKEFKLADRLIEIVGKMDPNKQQKSCLELIQTYLGIVDAGGDTEEIVRFGMESGICRNIFTNCNPLLKQSASLQLLIIIQLLLYAGEKHKLEAEELRNCIVEELEKYGQTDAICKLQYHSSKEVYEMAQHIIDEFFQQHNN